MTTPNVWLVMGCSSGLGKELALRALDAGHRVIATARNLRMLAELQEMGAKTLALDLSKDATELKTTVDEAIAIWGQIDVLINNAGQSRFGAAEELSEQEVMESLAVNVFGPRIIVNVGSVLSSLGRAGQSLYCSTKFALAGYTEALDQEIKHFGLRSIILQPGYINTSMLDVNANFFRASANIPAYYEPRSITEQVRDELANVQQHHPSDPKKVADVVIRTITDQDPA